MELRRLSAAPAEYRVERVKREDGGEDVFISGYGAVFEQYSKPIWDEWVEIISRNAFAETDMSDVVMVIDHARDVSSVLARSRNGEGTLEMNTGKDPRLCNGSDTAYLAALRIYKEHEGQGHISRMMKALEDHARRIGLRKLTIGVEANETRNLGIYLHWGYDTLVSWEQDGDALVLYYEKTL